MSSHPCPKFCHCEQSVFDWARVLSPSFIFVGCVQSADFYKALGLESDLGLEDAYKIACAAFWKVRTIWVYKV